MQKVLFSLVCTICATSGQSRWTSYTKESNQLHTTERARDSFTIEWWLLLLIEQEGCIKIRKGDQLRKRLEIIFCFCEKCQRRFKSTFFNALQSTHWASSQTYTSLQVSNGSSALLDSRKFPRKVPSVSWWNSALVQSPEGHYGSHVPRRQQPQLSDVVKDGDCLRDADISLGWLLAAFPISSDTLLLSRKFSDNDSGK